jgi:hypothetical protein
MRTLFIATSFLVLAAGAEAANVEDCTLKGEPCTPFFACVPETGEVFNGRSFGATGGAMVARSDQGATCSGRWRRTIFGLATARLDCSDGRSARALFNYFDERSGTAAGIGNLSAGERVYFWGGHNISDYFATNRKKTERRLKACARPAALTN